MRILHVPYSFYPDPAGGTEVYVNGLASCQRSMGVEAAVAAPASFGAPSSRYDHSGTPVWRFEISPALNLRELYGEGDRLAAEGFDKILEEFRPDVVHLHGVTSAISVLLAEAAARRGISLLFNYHTPTASCMRGTLLEWGTAICDGRISTHRCTACGLHGRGIHRTLANIIANEPTFVGPSLRGMNLEGGIWTALRAPELTDIRLRTFIRTLNLCDRVIALCNWTRELLLRNGIPENKLALCRQGISWSPDELPLPGTRPHASLPLHAVFLGRMDETKGPHVLIEALRANPGLPLRLDLFGVSQGGGGDTYAAKLNAMIGDDKRIRLLPPIPSAEVIARLAGYDAVLVPSQLLETGPLVVLEAFAARTPVIGSKLGGIAELVTDGLNGLLVAPHSSSAAWAAVLQRICNNPRLIDSLSAGIRPPRHSRQVASDLMPIYESAVSQKTTQSAFV